MNHKVYIAAPIVDITPRQRADISRLAHYASNNVEPEYEPYCPWLMKIPNAWNMPTDEWARCVFTQDVLALDEAEIVIVCDYGRHSSCGTAWEAGYAFAKNKIVIIVRMPDVEEVSLMVNNGCTAVVEYNNFISSTFDIQNYTNYQTNSDVIQN